MKAIILFLALILSPALFAKEVPLTINWKYINIVDGYDHTNKVKVYVDNVYKGESGSFVQSATGSFETKVTPGTHLIHIVNYTYYEGKWEEHTMENEYSIDADIEQNFDIKKATVISIVWNIDGGETIDVLQGGKPPKAKKGKEVSLTVEWKFTGVIDGYDHDNRIKVYANNELKGTSQQVKQTQKGKYVVKLPQGTYDIFIEDFAYYEGEWESHNRDNEYSVDAFVKEKINLSKSKTITIIFDIDTEKTTYVIK